MSSGPSLSWPPGWTRTPPWSRCWRWAPPDTSCARSSWPAPPRRELRSCSPPWRSTPGEEICVAPIPQSNQICFSRSSLVMLCLCLHHRHDLIKKLQALKDTDSDLAGLLLEQVLWVGSGYGKRVWSYFSIKKPHCYRGSQLTSLKNLLSISLLTCDGCHHISRLLICWFGFRAATAFWLIR